MYCAAPLVTVPQVSTGTQPQTIANTTASEIRIRPQGSNNRNDIAHLDLAWEIVPDKLTLQGGVDYKQYDFSTYEYDREATWSDKTVQVLVFDEANNVYVPTTVNLYEVVFGSTDWSDPTTDGGADDFAAAANDYLQAIEFVHDNEVR